MIDSLDLIVMGPALLAGLLVTATHVPLGQEVLRRGIIFLDLTLAQVASVGVIAAHSIGWESNGWQMQLSAITAAILGALLLRYFERHWPEVQEALIGSVFVLSASIGIILLANNPQSGEHLKEILVGQILWVSVQELGLPLLVYLGVLTMWFGFRPRVRGTGFYLLFAVTVTLSVQLVGVYLVFATLIFPALATRKLNSFGALVLGYCIGIIAYALGLLLSSIFDLPSGGIIVCCLAVVSIVMARLPGITRFSTKSPNSA